MVAPGTPEWPRWVLFLALGGFAGNFIFSLTDHAQNGFFNPLEWLPVASSACAIGFLLVVLEARIDEAFLRLCAVVCSFRVWLEPWVRLARAADLRSRARRCSNES
jgi:hypothetical protein